MKVTDEMVARAAKAMYAVTVTECVRFERFIGAWDTDEAAFAAEARLLEGGKYFDDQIAKRLPEARAALEAAFVYTPEPGDASTRL